MICFERGRLLLLLIGLSLVTWDTKQLLEAQSAEDQSRDSWERSADVLAALGVQPGARVADLGAGDGFYTVRLARSIGPGGQVLAVDIDQRMIEKLRETTNREGLRNVDVIAGDPADPHLPADTLDAVLIMNAYHEMREHASMLRHIRTALCRGARLVLVEPIAESRRDATREDQVKAHEIGPEYVVQELHAAGFRVVKLDGAFAVHPQSGQTRWLVVAVPGGEKSITTAADPSPVATTASDDDGWKDPTLRISLVEYKELIAKQHVVTVDVRGASDYAAGHLPSAISIPLDAVDSKAASLIPSGTAIVTYCS